MTVTIRPASNAAEWDQFLAQQPYSPFLQSWTMGDVYADVGQQPLRLAGFDEQGRMIAACFGHVVPARRGRHLSIPYGPVVAALPERETAGILETLFEAWKQLALEHRCRFIRFSPFWPQSDATTSAIVDGWLTGKRLSGQRVTASPLHLLAEHLWLLKLEGKTKEGILADMRKTTRNLIRRAERDGVQIIQSLDPRADIRHFLALHDETRQRHKFTPYTNAFFQSQVTHFAAKDQCSLYLAMFNGEVIAASIHMHFGGETSYHHGASSSKHAKVPASYLLQWRAIQDAMDRGDRLYNFWGIAPAIATTEGDASGPQFQKDHPFSGVTTFKTGFGGELVPLVHCMDLPLSPWYALTRTLEQLRKWRRGF